MTLLELCDELETDLIIKRLHKKGKIQYLVNIFNTWIQPNQKAQVAGSDVNALLYDLCEKVSYKDIYISSRSYKKIKTERIEKGNLSILGVW